MGRKKQYDRDELIARAMEMFRDHGFAGTSAQMLTDGLKVNRNSLYAEFGNKQGLFDAALERYEQTVIDTSFSPIEAPGAGVAEIVALFEFYGSTRASRATGRGCLLCNTAVEFGAEDPSGAGFVRRYFKRLSRAFRSALTNARADGDLLPSSDPNAEADFLTASVLGLFVMLRAKAPRSVIRGAAHAAVQHLETLRVSSAEPS